MNTWGLLRIPNFPQNGQFRAFSSKMHKRTTGSTTLSNSREFQDSNILEHRGLTVEHSHNRNKYDRDLLVRAARGDPNIERVPVWLMRQAGRYQSAFRRYSDQYSFRHRSETPEIATELSLLCQRAYGMDGIIIFSDILTPLPCLGIDFDVVKGSGPVVSTPHLIRTVDDVSALPRFAFDEKVPFIKEIMNTLSREAEKLNTSLIGFIGSPFTLAAYILEGRSSKHCLVTKQLLYEDLAGTNSCFSSFLDLLSTFISEYACHQIENGAQVVQIFESWAHHLSPATFRDFAKPAVQNTICLIKERYPTVPLIYYTNGGSSFLELQGDLGADTIGIDWSIDPRTARKILGDFIGLSGNIDPALLVHGNKEQVEGAVRDCLSAGISVLNLGHGVRQETPEVAVQWVVDAAKRYG